MKKRLTLTLPAETILYIKAKAKERNITASQLVEEVLLKFLAQEEAEEKLRKVS